jgi:small GTP-binding protein
MSIYNYKVSLVGRSGVGKSSFAVRIVRDTFHSDQEATIGAAFLTKQIKTNPGDIPSIIQLQIWDTAGQERYHSLVPMYTRGAHILILCVDSPDINSLQRDMKTYKADDFPSTVFIIVTKSDMITNRSDYDEIQKFCNDMMYPIYFISNKTSEGIADLIEAMKLECMQQNPINPNVPKPMLHKSIVEKECCAT